MYDYDKILKESLDELFDKDFDNINEKKELNLGLTLLNVPRINKENTKSNKFYKKNNTKAKGEILKFCLVIVFFLIMFLGAYPTIKSDIFNNEKAQVVKEKNIEYICEVITQGELKTTGKGSCSIIDNNIKMRSSFVTLNDSINYMLIITNNSSKAISIKKYESINLSEQINTTYKMFYNNKEINYDNEVKKEKVTLEPKESLIVIVNQRYKEQYSLNLEEFEYNINIDF